MHETYVFLLAVLAGIVVALGIISIPTKWKAWEDYKLRTYGRFSVLRFLLGMENRYEQFLQQKE